MNLLLKNLIASTDKINCTGNNITLYLGKIKKSENNRILEKQ